MKKIFLTLIMFISVIITQAQFQLGLLTDYHYSYLYNKSDAAADERLNYVNTFKPAFGAIIGYKINDKFALQISPQYFGAGQKFNSPAPSLGLSKSVDDNISLHYLQLPVSIEYAFGSKSAKIRHSINFGMYAGSLIDYNQITIYDGYEITNINKVKKTSVTIKGREVSANTIFESSKSDSSVITNFKTSHSFFNNLDVGLIAGYGIRFFISPNITLQANLNGRYGFAAVDYIDSNVATNTANPNDIRKFSLKDVIYCRNNVANSVPSQALRDPKSNNISAGLQLSFIYTLPNNKSKK
jgi:Outer membrane protein beta-barrel domain